MIRAIQITERVQTEDEARMILEALEDQEGWYGGRIVPKGDGWLVQGFVEDNPHAGDMWLPDGMRRVEVPYRLARELGFEPPAFTFPEEGVIRSCETGEPMPDDYEGLVISYAGAEPNGRTSLMACWFEGGERNWRCLYSLFTGLPTGGDA